MATWMKLIIEWRDIPEEKWPNQDQCDLMTEGFRNALINFPEFTQSGIDSRTGEAASFWLGGSMQQLEEVLAILHKIGYPCRGSCKPAERARPKHEYPPMILSNPSYKINPVTEEMFMDIWNEQFENV